MSLITGTTLFVCVFSEFFLLLLVNFLHYRR